MIENDAIESRLIGRELSAAAKLLSEWSCKSEADPNTKFWKSKIKKLRDFVFDGIGGGQKESVPHDLVHEEYQVILEAVRFAKKSAGMKKLRSSTLHHLANVPTEYTIGEMQVVRPLPITKSGLETIANNLNSISISPSDLANEIVAYRYGMKSNTAHKAKHKKPIRSPDSLPMSLLASVLLDLLTSRNASESDLADEVFDTLLASKYFGICLFYQVLLAHATPHPIVDETMSGESIKLLCRYVVSDDYVRLLERQSSRADRVAPE